MRHAPALALCAAVLLAGCGSSEEGGVAELHEGPLLLRAVREMPAVWTAHLRVHPTSAAEITLSTTLDAGANTTYAEFGGSAATLAAIGATVGADAYLARGVAIHRTPHGTAYVANATSYVQPPEGPERRRSAAFAPDLDAGPVGALLDVRARIDALVAPGTRVAQATTVQWEGRDALQMEIEGAAPGTKVVVTRTDPPRLVHLLTRIPPDPSTPASVLDNATLAGTLHYEAAEILRPAPAVSRALALAYVVERGEGELRWRFVGTGGIPLHEVEVQVKRPPPNGSAPDPSVLPTAWTFDPSTRTRTEGNATLAFEDADADGAISEGDRLIARPTPGATLPPLVFYDLVTGTRLIPGAPPLLALMLALACAWRGRGRATIP